MNDNKKIIFQFYSFWNRKKIKHKDYNKLFNNESILHCLCIRAT